MITYSVYCDGCGSYVNSSGLSARAARAEAQLIHGANHGPDGDLCLACRKARNTLAADHYTKAASAAHGRGLGIGDKGLESRDLKRPKENGAAGED